MLYMGVQTMIYRILGIVVFLSVAAASVWPQVNASAVNPAQDLIYKAQQAENRYLYSEALSFYQKAIELDSNNAELYVGVARQLIGLERLAEARDTLEKAVQVKPDHAEAQTLLGVYFQKIANDFPAAETHFRSAIQGDPQYARSQYLLGELYISLQRLDDARAVYEQLCKNVPGVYEGHFGLGSVLLKQNAAEEAIKELKRAIDIKPADPETYRLLGQALAKLGKKEESQAALKQYQERKDNENKLTQLLRAARRNPTVPDNWFQLGGFYLRNRESRKAIEAFERGLELEPKRTAVYGYVGALYLQLKDLEPAEKYLRQAIDLDPKNPEPYNNLGVCYMFKNDYRNAADAFQKSIDLGNKDPRVTGNLQSALKKYQEKN
jgi:O-antigen biosynthesis protein